MPWRNVKPEPNTDRLISNSYAHHLTLSVHVVVLFSWQAVLIDVLAISDY